MNATVEMPWLSSKVVIFLIIATPTHGLLHVTYVVLINPILSDSFGFSEKESGYVFLGLVIAQVVGAILMYVTSSDLRNGIPVLQLK